MRGGREREGEREREVEDFLTLMNECKHFWCWKRVRKGLGAGKGGGGAWRVSKLRTIAESVVVERTPGWSGEESLHELGKEASGNIFGGGAHGAARHGQGQGAQQQSLAAPVLLV